MRSVAARWTSSQAYRNGEAPKVPGVGAAISDKIKELATTGRMGYYDRLCAEIPPSLVELLRIPGLGRGACARSMPSSASRRWRTCARRPRRGELRSLRGLSVKTEQLILEGIDRLESAPKRMLLHRAEVTLLGLMEALTDMPGVQSIEPAGSFRRRRESIGDLDLLAETDDGPGLIERFTTLGVVDHVVNKGGYKAAVRLLRGPQADLMVMPPGTAGTYRIHFTGSKEHNVRLRERARDSGLEPVREGLPAHRRGR